MELKIIKTTMRQGYDNDNTYLGIPENPRVLRPVVIPMTFDYVNFNRDTTISIVIADYSYINEELEQKVLHSFCQKEIIEIDL